MISARLPYTPGQPCILSCNIKTKNVAYYAASGEKLGEERCISADRVQNWTAHSAWLGQDMLGTAWIAVVCESLGAGDVRPDNFSLANINLLKM